MGNQDSMQTGLNLFNSDKLAEALSMFEIACKKQSDK